MTGASSPPAPPPYPALGSVQFVIVGLALVVLAFVLWLVKRRHLREEYTPIWLIVSLTAVVLTVFEGLLRTLARAIGAWTLSSALFFFAVVFLTLISLQYAVRLSRLQLEVKNLTQELALLKAEREAEPGNGERQAEREAEREAEPGDGERQLR